MRGGRKTTRRRMACGLCGGLIACVALPARAEPDAAGPDGLEHLVSQWVELRDQVAAEKRDWAERRQRLEAEIRLLETEKGELARDIAETGAATKVTEEERSELRQRIDRAQAVLDGIHAHLAAAESDARGWDKRWPEALGEAPRRLLGKLPDGEAVPADGSVTRRLQTLVAFYTELETLQHNIHAATEVVPTPEGPRVAADVLYIGLARAFAVSPDDRWAGVGEPGEDGWTWSSRPELGVEIRRAIRMFRRETPAQSLTLPLAIR